MTNVAALPGASRIHSAAASQQPDRHSSVCARRSPLRKPDDAV